MIAGGGAVKLSATNDVNIGSTTESHLSDTAIHRESSSTFKKSSSTSADYSASTLAIGSSISGGNVTVSAGNDIKVAASQVTAEEALKLDASRDLVVTTATSTGSEQHAHEEKKSGFSFSAEGIGYSTYTNMHVNGDNVKVTSGGDTTLKGGVIAANTVKADVGGDLKTRLADK